MSDFLPAAVGAVVSDVLSVCGVPGASTVGMAFSAAVEAVMTRRRDNAREILLEELRKGKAFVDQATSIDEWVAVLLRYSRAAQEGTARLNLRLMAKVIAGQAQAGPLVADEFLGWADALASLRREEVILIASFGLTLDEWRAEPPQEKGDSRSSVSLWKAVASQLIPGAFKDERWMRSAACSSLRTGLLVSSAGLGGDGFFSVSPLFDKIRQTVSFHDALREEGAI